MRTRFLSTALAILALGITSGRLSAQGGSTVCKDGTTSAASGKGACSGHGGVDAKATSAASKKGATPATKATPAPAATKSAPPAAAKSVVTETPAATKSAAATKSVPAKKTAKASDKDPTDAVAKCKDGTYSHQATHQGACSRHGGVDKFLKP